MAHHTLQKLLLKVIYFIFIIILLSVQNLGAQTDILKKAHSIFTSIEEQDRLIDKLASIGNDEGAHNLPIGIKNIAGNTPITLAITKIKFGREYGELSMLVKMDIQQNAEPLIFGASGLKITKKGDLVGEIKLSLLSNVPIPVGNMGKVILKGSMDTTGTFFSKTYIELDCNGNFKELSLDADIQLNKNTFKPARPASPADSVVVGSFRTIISDWNDLIVETTFPPFEIKGINGFEFNVSKASLDLSDFKNPSSFNPIGNYLNEHFTLPDKNLWRGIYIDEFSLTFPEQFKKRDSSERLILGASRLLIDEKGVTGEIFGENVILPLDQGDAGGWAFSVSDFKLQLVTNNIKGFGFGGEISVPLSEKTQNLKYEAFIAKDEYFFKANVRDSLDFNLFGNAKLHLDSTSYIEMKLKDKSFRPKLVMNGAMRLESDGLKMEQLTFTKLAFSTESPIFSVESMYYGGEVKLFNFPITISKINITANDNIAALGFDLKVNLMKDKIAADSRLKISSENKNNRWSYKGLTIEKMRLEKVQMAGFSLNGEIRMAKDHPIYGNYFGGEIEATFDALSKLCSVKTTAVFGNKGFRYWYVEGSADFKAGIPIGPVILNGFMGGAYYRMSATGGKGLDAYAPYEKCSLGLKAGVKYSIGNKAAVSGDALFEMNFLAAGGIKNIRFYGSAKFMDVATLTGDKLGKLAELHNKAMTELESLDKSLADKLPERMHGTDVSKNLLPDLNLSMGVTAYLTMDYDFPLKKFEADFRVMINTPGGLLRGAGNNNEAGWAKLYCTPQKWYIHVGKPSNPVGVKLGLGPLSLTTESYFMLGDELERPILDPKLLQVIKISPEQADYMKLPNIMSEGKGVAFGSRFTFDTGNLTFLILYARFMAGTGFDVALQNLSDYECADNPGKSIGINGWYANGQCYAYLSGELGVKIKLLFIKKKFTIIKGSAGALLQARLPNPTWIGGYMAVDLKVLGGLIKANMKMKFSFGDDCKLVRKDGDYSPVDFPIISDLAPADRDSEVDVFVAPQATLNVKAEEAFDAEDENGNTRTYRVKLKDEDFYVLDDKGQKIQGKVIWNRTLDVVSFEPHEILPPHKDIKVVIAVNFEELVNGSWRLVTSNGKPARESKTHVFKTGEAPNYIPLTNIEYCHPVIAQNNFFRNESSTGYVQLKRGQSYLFPDNFIYNTLFTKDGNSVKADFRYNASDKNVTYSFPKLNGKTEYEVAFVASTQASTGGTAPSQKVISSQTLNQEDGESITIDYMQQAAQKIIKEGSLKVLDYTFRSSEFNTFKDKMSSLNLKKGAIDVNSDVWVLFLNTSKKYELFDETDLLGSIYTADKPLIKGEAQLDNNYYRKAIGPYIYDWYPFGGIKIENRDENILGAPPVRGFTIFSGYMERTVRASTVMPMVYSLPFYYNEDFYELRNKAANWSIRNGNTPASIQKIVGGQFPVILKAEDYKAKLQFILPGGKTGSEFTVKYIYW